MEISGSPTEKAILQWGVNLGMEFGAAQSHSVIIHAFPFNSEKKAWRSCYETGCATWIWYNNTCEISQPSPAQSAYNHLPDISISSSVYYSLQPFPCSQIFKQLNYIKSSG